MIAGWFCLLTRRTHFCERELKLRCRRIWEAVWMLSCTEPENPVKSKLFFPFAYSRDLDLNLNSWTEENAYQISSKCIMSFIVFLGNMMEEGDERCSCWSWWTYSYFLPPARCFLVFEFSNFSMMLVMASNRPDHLDWAVNDRLVNQLLSLSFFSNSVYQAVDLLIHIVL